MTYTRPQALILTQRLSEPPRLIHILAGPRQVGKSTLVQQVLHRRPVGSYRLLGVEALAPRQAAAGGTWVAAQWAAGERGGGPPPHRAILAAQAELVEAARA